MVIHTSKSPEETFSFARSLGQSAQPGLVLGLIGDLGAGKTQFARGFAHGLNVSERVHSPTFTLVNEYRSGRFPCYHLDLYRLSSAEQIVSAGLLPYFRPEEAVTLIEWFDRARGQIDVNENTRIITLSVKSETERIISYEDPRT